MKPEYAKLALVPAACFLLSSCATVDRMGASHGTAIGCGVGSVMGAVVGDLVGRKLGSAGAGLVVGAAAGAWAGCTLGGRWQRHQQQLQALAKNEHIRIETELLSAPVVEAPGTSSAPIGAAQAPGQAGLVAQVQNAGMFASDSADFTIQGRRQAEALAAIYKADFLPEAGRPAGPQPVLLVVGHTDASGSAGHNQQLSEQRARAMGEVLAQAGINPRDVYYQGAGSSRPIAENTDAQGRAINRRVELVELASADLLMARIRQEQGNPRYLAYGTSEQVPASSEFHGSASDRKVRLPAHSRTAHPGRQDQSAAELATSRPPATAPDHSPSTSTIPSPSTNFVDFGGQPAEQAAWGLASYLQPMHSGLSLVSSALADSPPMRSCMADQPRMAGVVKSLANGQSVESYPTRDYLPGMNARAWAGLVNGNLVTLTPVAILREGAVVTENPKAWVTRGYSSGARQLRGMSTQANTYEAADYVLYRVFVHGRGEAMSCMDVVLPKSGPLIAPAGRLYYPRAGQSYVADFKPQRG